MKFICERKTLYEAAKKAAGVSPGRHPIEILNGVLIECSEDNNEIYLTATNHNISIMQKVKGNVEESGKAVVEAAILPQILSKWEDETICFHYEANRSNHMFIMPMGKKSWFDIRALKVEHFIKPAMAFPEESVIMKGICSLFKRTVLAVNKESDIPVMQCLKLSLSPDNSIAYALNTQSVVMVNSDAKAGSAAEYLIPAESMAVLASIVTDSDEFEVGSVDNAVVFTKEDMIFSIKTITGLFPNVAPIIDGFTPISSAIVDAEAFMKLLGRVKVFSPQAAFRIILKDNELSICFMEKLNNFNDSIPSKTQIASKPAKQVLYSLSGLYDFVKISQGLIKIQFDKVGFMVIKTKSQIYCQLPRAYKENKAAA